MPAKRKKLAPLTDEAFLDGVFIQEGVSPTRGVVVVCGTIGDDDDNPETTIGVRRKVGWVGLGLDGDAALSVDANASGQAFVLGESGSVTVFEWSSTSDAAIERSAALIENPEAEERGPLRRLRVLGREVVSVGSVGQAYRLARNSFVALPPLKAGRTTPTIEDLAGTSSASFVAVTSEGHAAHFDGTSWRLLRVPRRASFTSMCMTRRGHYAICGKAGVVLVGPPHALAVVPNLDPRTDYWGIAADGGRLYAAHLGGIDEIVATGARPVVIAERAALKLSFTVLRSSTDGVWSFAERTIGRIKNGAWRTVTS